jgi:hypothetical protein
MASNPSNHDGSKKLPVYDSCDVTIIIDEGPGDTTVRPRRPSLLKCLPPGPWLDKLETNGKSDQENPAQPEGERAEPEQ